MRGEAGQQQGRVLRPAPPRPEDRGFGMPVYTLTGAGTDPLVTVLTIAGNRYETLTLDR